MSRALLFFAVPLVATILNTMLSAASLAADDAVSFDQEVRPILSNNCFACHGPDEANRQADMRLDVPGKVDFEEVITRITSDDPYLKMPPAESNKQLKPEQIVTLRKWIGAGAPYEKHWSFVPPQANEIPEPQDSQWSDQPIDRFVLERLEKKGLRPSARAERRTLIRRVTFDLTGLPPTTAEIDEFLNDSSEQAYEKLVDRLLAKPQYGEHMARYWLDLVRFADTNGLHHDHFRDMSPYRDWVIRSFNDNLPFDEFIVDQVAGDLFPDPTLDEQIASGFNRLHLIIDVGTALPEESFMRNVVDRTSAFGTAFLGLTVQCAVCHDHKYDPITQKNFYQLYAFFNNFDGEPETGRRGTSDFKRGLQPPYVNIPSPEQAVELARFDERIAKLDARVKSLATEQTKVSLDTSKSNDSTAELKKLQAKLEKERTARESLLRAVPAAMVMKERKEVRPAHVLIRGAYDQPGDLAERGTPSFLPPLEKAGETATRMDLAEWLVQPTHPLTARVAANRFWQQFFGIGLVKTSEDFGAQGEAPSHPELLDYLAKQFVDSGWDVKALVQSIVLSQSYQQSSQASREQFLTDPENRLLARGPRFRLDAEMIRDQVLAVSGLLNPEMYGKSVKPPQPDGLWAIVTMPYSYPRVFVADKGDQIYRRSVYTFWKRGLPPPQMTIFDAPARDRCIARRERTNTPLQALLMMNEPQYFSATMHFAEELLEEPDLDQAARIRRAYETITSQVPSEAALAEMKAAWQTFHKRYTDNPTAAKAMLANRIPADDEPINAPKAQANLAAWTMLVHSMMNLDAVKTRE